MLLNAKQACGYLNIGRYLFNSAVNKGLIPFICLSKRRLFRIEDLDRCQNNVQFHSDYSSVAKSTTHTSLSCQKQGKGYSLEKLLEEQQSMKLHNIALKELSKSTKKHIAKANYLQLQ